MESSAAAFSGVQPVAERLAFDVAALERWMAANVDGFHGPLTAHQFKGGQSNPTYRLDTPSRRYVLRRRPPGELLPSAHAVDREFRVIGALHRGGFPVAEAFALCMDRAVIGTEFFVMAMVEGRIFWDAALPGLDPAERRGLHVSAVRTLARLHACDPATLGLSDYGKPGNYFARQVERWTRQYRASETTAKPAMDRLIAWLPASVPAQERSSVVHGDFRLDNMIFAADRVDVLAVLDWELSTLGDPLADLTYYLMQWHIPADGRSGMLGLDLDGLGIPPVEAAAELYCSLTGRSGLPDLDWYFAYNLFRLAAILQGVAGRVRDGTATSARAVQMAARAEPLAERAWQFALKAGA